MGWHLTGYGQQTALFTPRLAELGHEVAISTFYGLHGQSTAWRPTAEHAPITVYPGGVDVYANDVVGAHYRDWTKPTGGLLFLLTDPWVMKAQIIRQLPTLAWVPVDHDPAPPIVTTWFGETGAVPLAMSRFGQELLADAGFETLYCPHGVNLEVFKPGDEARARQLTDLPPDKFIVGMVAANQGRPGRKGWSEALQGYAKFARGKRDVALYLHTQLVNAAMGEPLLDIIRSLQLKPYCVDQYSYVRGLPANYVAEIMRGLNVLLNPSHGEGFGITVLEAAACGTPAVVTKFSAMPEVIGESGWQVGGQRVWTRFDSWQLVPSVDQVARSLSAAYEEWRDGRAARARSRAAVRQARKYEANLVLRKYLGPALEEAREMLRWRESQPNIVRG